MIDEQLRILLISTQFPFPPRSGFTMRVQQLAVQLASRHDVTLLSYVEPGRSDDVARLRESLRVEVVERAWGSVASKRLTQIVTAGSRRPFLCRLLYSRELQTAIDELSAKKRFDVVQLESSPLCAFRLPRESRLILDEHNVEYEVFERIHEAEHSPFRRAFNWREYKRFMKFEHGCWKEADGCVVTSEREERIVGAVAPQTPVAVVPNGVDLEFFRPQHRDPDPWTVVFNGVLDYRPNLDAAYHLIDDIWPLVLDQVPDAKLAIVGRGDEGELRRLRRPGIVVTGEVPDVRPHLVEAAVLVVPIRMGGGTRLKVVEGLSLAKAMVSTSLGCEGVNVRDGEQLLVADTPREFAAAIVRLFEDRALGAELGRAGRARMEQEYSWDHAGDLLEELYRRVLSAA